MKVPVLIDSSVWIGFLRGDAQTKELLKAPLQSGTAALCPVIWFELYSGARGERELEALNQIKALCLWLEIDAAVWEQASDLGAKARRSGLNCPMGDVVIAACAARHGALLIHQDKHFVALEALP